MVEKTYNEIKTIKEYALVNKVPIMVDDSIDFIISKIHQKRVKKVLEIGTAIGYSAIMMALSSPNLTITSIEKDKDRYLEAVKNIKKFNLEDRITLIYNDALEVSLKEKYDLILIDAAKSKNLDFFNKFEKNLEPNGIIITDNLSFHGYVEQEPSQIKNRNIRALVRKIRNYIDFLENNLKYKTTFYEIGDGLSVTEKRMWYNMKLLIIPTSINIKKYENASAFLFGLKDFSYTTPISITLKDLKKIKQKTNKEIFVKIDKNIFNKDIESLKKTLLELDKLNINGIFFYDLSVLSLSKKLNLKTPLIWNQNFFVTNYKTCNHYEAQGVYGAVTSSEITLQEILEIRKNTNFKLFVNIFGYQMMAFSKRKLITNYFKYLKKKNYKRNNYIIEKDKKFLIKETKEGTMILSDKILNGLKYKEELENSKIDYLILDQTMIKDKDFKKVLQAIKDNKDINNIIPNTDTLFLDKKTIYKVKRWKE